MKGKVGVRLLSSTTVSTGYDIISFYPPTVLRQGHWRPHMQFCCILIFCIGLPVNSYANISLWGRETFVLTDTGAWWQLVTRQGQGHVRTPCCLQWGRCQCRGPNCKKNKKQCCFSCSCFCTKNICHFQESSKHQHNCIASILFLYPSINLLY